MQLIVGNDGGGTIFDALEVAGSAARRGVRPGAVHAAAVDLAALAAAYGWAYRACDHRGELDEALTAPRRRPSSRGAAAALSRRTRLAESAPMPQPHIRRLPSSPCRGIRSVDRMGSTRHGVARGSVT